MLPASGSKIIPNSLDALNLLLSFCLSRSNQNQIVQLFKTMIHLRYRLGTLSRNVRNCMSNQIRGLHPTRLMPWYPLKRKTGTFIATVCKAVSHSIGVDSNFLNILNTVPLSETRILSEDECRRMHQTLICCGKANEGRTKFWNLHVFRDATRKALLHGFSHHNCGKLHH